MDDQTTHPCPVPGCKVQAVPAHHVMCGTCWARVPGHMQNMVYRAWNRGCPTSTYLSCRQMAIDLAAAWGRGQ